jgi:hypothetical protein
MNFLWTPAKFLSYKTENTGTTKCGEDDSGVFDPYFGVEGFFCLWQNVARFW